MVYTRFGLPPQPCAVVVYSVSPTMFSAGKRACSSRTWLSSWTFQSAFIPATFDLERIFSSFCQPVRCGLPPSVSQSAAGSIAHPARIATTRSRFRITRHLSGDNGTPYPQRVARHADLKRIKSDGVCQPEIGAGGVQR